MGPSLFHEIIYGPVKSRRLGNSLGINIIPTNEKYVHLIAYIANVDGLKSSPQIILSIVKLSKIF